jgi:hypothetical protein
MKFVAYDPQVKSRQPVCLICKAYGWTVRLNFNREHGFWWCPDCGGEWWPGGGERWPGTDDDNDDGSDSLGPG